MTLKKFALNYNHGSMAELLKFLKQRNGHDPLKSNIRKTRRQCRKRWIAKLRRLDLNATFRLLALPPELQNIVYDFALTHDRTKDSKACPAFLSASSRIHNDAVGISNANNVLELSNLFHRFVYHSLTTKWMELKQGGPGARSETIESGHNIAAYIPGLRSIQSIHLNLTFRQSSVRGINVPAGNWNDVTDFLTELLTSCQSLKHITVEIDDNPSAGDWGLQTQKH
ncbi:hypothetical protein DOTSEDRAFT_25852 [Dothistroma septosporum NZE10]|uniref:F-box domain-containing protein n=1 Tax=Dothistroma septosporum (strain NZE10 / CBS 128990) TaxID=675120 RepID=N1PI02_DOTSN|nr:hypothetical protein DOTSEDRAFT_25852 [Dothistroma septosporum NZE10]